MADIRINALATTATSAASDDYVALDGAANGTRKILASNIAQNVSDVVLGVNGPSVKSSLDARAARQGLVFDGTAGATVSVPAFGTGDFSCAFIASVNNFTNYNGLVGNTTNVGNFFFGTRSSVGDLGVIVTGGGGVGWISSGFVPVIGKTYSFVYTRSGTTGKFYVDGVLIATASDPDNYSTALNQFGANAGTNNVWPGSIEQGFIYNRALSASEVVSLFEAGVPAGADYGQGTNDSGATVYAGGSMINGANSTFASDTGYWTLQTNVTISGGKCNFAATPQFAGLVRFNILTIGKKYRFTFTIGSLTAGNTLYIDGLTATWNFTSNGTYTVEDYATKTYFKIGVLSATGTCTLDDITATPVGLLLAPDAYQAGGGLAWYDTSGNAANITLPASGVSWNVPSSQKTASGWTYGGNLATSGNLTVSGTGQNAFGASFSPLSWGVPSIDINGASGGLFAVYYGGSARGYFLGNSADVTINTQGSYPIVFKINSSEQARITSGGNLLLGTPIDSGNGKLQLATHTTSAGGIGFGTDTSLFRQGAGLVQLVGVGTGGWPTLKISDDASSSASFQTGVLALGDGNSTARNVGIWRGAANSIVTVGNVLNLGGYAGITFTTGAAQIGSQTTALTLDSSQRTILSGPLRLANAYAAGAPAATGYVTIQDSSGTTYKVLVST